MRRPTVLLCTDPGPDPDDVKVILILGIAHLGRKVNLTAVICNGGGQARERACLARCLLDKIGAYGVPVGIGSEGSPTSAGSHEYNLGGFAQVDQSRLLHGPKLLSDALRQAPRNSVRLLLISSMRDVADLFEREPSLVLSRLQSVVIQGGLQRDEATGSWVADTASNNEFDMDAANAVYSACQQSGLPMTVVSRHAVPLLPMQLANSFALRTECPVMCYLANAQSLGLIALWGKLCAGQLPARCTKQWYFETFCGIDATEFARLGFQHLAEGDDVGLHLNGFVKPYDVVAALAVLDETVPVLREAALRSSDPSLYTEKHTLLLEPAQKVEIEHVVEVLRTTYHAIVEITAARELPRAARLFWPGGDPASTRAVRLIASAVRRSGSQTECSFSSRRTSRVLPLPSGDRDTLPESVAAQQPATRPPAPPARVCMQGDPACEQEEELALRDALRAARAGARNAQRAQGNGGGRGSMRDVRSAARVATCLAPGSSSPRRMDAVGDAVIRLLVLGERRVFAHLRVLSVFAFSWGGCSLFLLLGFFLLSAQLTDYSDDGTRWVLANGITLVIQISLIVSMLFVPAIHANITLIRAAVGVVLISCAAAMSTFSSLSTALFTRRLRAGVLPLWEHVFGARAVDANIAYLTLSFASALLLFAVCLVTLRVHWRSPERLVASFWLCWAMAFFSEAPLNWLVSTLMLYYRVYPAHNLVIAQAIHLCKFCAIAFSASHWTRSHVQALISRALASRASFWCSLAALSGVGGLHSGQLPRLLVEKATRSFGAHVRPLPAQDDCDTLLCTLLSSSSALGLLPQLSSLPAGRPPDHAERPAEPVVFADAYVVHAPPRDEAGAGYLAAALRSWAAHFERTHGRPPVLYAETLSRDVSLSPLDNVQHMPIYLARSDRLLILLTREIFDDPRRVSVCMAWAALGCDVSEVDVEVAEGDPFAVSAAVGGVDAFKVPTVQAGPESGEGDAIRAARLALELTGKMLVQSTIYDLLPICVEAAKRTRASFGLTRTKSCSSQDS